MEDSGLLMRELRKGDSVDCCIVRFVLLRPRGETKTRGLSIVMLSSRDRL